LFVPQEGTETKEERKTEERKKEEKEREKENKERERGGGRDVLAVAEDVRE
jgi:hypothetical protein